MGREEEWWDGLASEEKEGVVRAKRCLSTRIRDSSLNLALSHDSTPLHRCNVTNTECCKLQDLSLFFLGGGQAAITSMIDG